MDSNCLRIIANPHLLKKNVPKQKILNDNIKNNKLLGQYLENKYRGLYLHPKIHHEIIDAIDKIIIQYISHKLVQDIIKNVLKKFDTNY